MYDKEFDAIRQAVYDRLKLLDPKLTYHNIAHTMDVLKQAERIARKEGINESDIRILKVAALYHDSGFLKTYKNHEEMSCSVFFEDSARFHFTSEEEEKITGLILATKVPQEPGNLLEQIICDADLDYLGRNDFFTIGQELHKEFMAFGIVKSNEEWEQLQMNFLKKHQYHTHTSRQEREPVKQKNIQQLA
ncbi:MAG TPA: HD domain-containing protein [Chitinophagaceae bacterium]|nr:HD domain-containing protein [Chitinophagaceae bacterium]